MSDFPLDVRTTEEMARLPSPPKVAAISSPGFDSLCEAWRGQGVWLSLWDSEGRMFEADTKPTEHWSRLCGKAPFGRALEKHVGEFASLCSDGARQSRFSWGGPWGEDLGVLVIPIGPDHRRRAHLVAVAILREGLGEDYSRLCDACHLDAEHMRRLAKASYSSSTKDAEAVGRVLAHGAELQASLEMSQRDVLVLTHNLESTYEELHLIYAIADELTLRRQPAVILEAVGRKVLETSRAASLCFVLGPGRTGDSADGSNAPLVFDRIDAIVRVGEMSASSHAIERLVQNLPGLMQSGRQQVLINNAPRYAELSWSSSWLKHLAVFPLSRERELFGSLLAINCRDEGDFTTIDAHLLRTVCDRLSAFLANHHLFQDLADLLMGLLHSMVNSIDAKDAYTAGHSERVAHISRILAQSIGLGSEECNRVYLAGLLHDVGKIGVADSILCKPGKLTTEEFDALKKHPEIGKKILSPVRQIQDLLPGVLHHHERMDGNGYPHKLAGEDIPLLGRLICLADCFDAMTTSRTYRAALELPEAIAEIRRCAGTQFDPRLAEVFLKLDLPEVMRVAQAGTKQDPLGACNFGSDWAARIVADQVDA